MNWSNWKKTIVTKNNFDQCINEILGQDYSCDTETTGLNSFKGDELFSVIFATDTAGYYFNFNTKDAWFNSAYCELTSKKAGTGFRKSGKIIKQRILIPIPKKYILPIEYIKKLQPIFDQEDIQVDMQNIKFDMHMLKKENIDVKNELFCTEVGARITRNDLPTYKLSYLSKLIGEFKSDAVEEYIKANQCWEWVEREGQKRYKDKHFDRVEFFCVAEYGLRDAFVTRKLGKYERKRFKEMDESKSDEQPSVKSVMDNEKLLSHHLFNMEHTGILLDVNFTTNAMNHAVEQYKKAEKEFGMMTGLDFVDSEKVFMPAFKELDLAWGVTKKGQPSFAKDVLEGLDHPLANIIKTHREWYKKAHTYFGNYLMMRDPNDIIHCNFRQGGTTHGRISCANPNLQNVNNEKSDSGKFIVRRCFIPRPKFMFAMLDYDQMEYRLMLDYAGEMGVIKMVLDGMDIHTATKETMGIKDREKMTARDIAKRINFLLIYGGGNAILCLFLFKVPIDEDLLKDIWNSIWKEKYNEYDIANRFGIEQELATLAYTSLNETFEYRQLYFSKLPNVKKFIMQVQDAAKSRGYIYNWLGRRCYFNKGHEYKAPNHLIAGGCADIVKKAMVQMGERLTPTRSKMILQVHDEIVFEIYQGEENTLPDLQAIMQNIYPHEHVPLTVGIDFSKKSWADKETWK